MKQSTKPHVILVGDNLPHVNERVMVVCKGLRCLGFLDRNTIWRDANHLTALTNVVAWYRMGSDASTPPPAQSDAQQTRPPLGGR